LALLKRVPVLLRSLTRRFRLPGGCPGASKSRTALACSTWSRSPSVRAAPCRSLNIVSARGSAAGLTSSAVTVALGATKLRREIAARLGEAGDKPHRDRIIAGGEHDRNAGGRRFCWQHWCRAVRGNHIHLATPVAPASRMHARQPGPARASGAKPIPEAPRSPDGTCVLRLN
jgi:hypothetical protein